MLAMIATQIAITACLGCVPIDDGAMHSERSTWSDAETHLQLTHTPKAATMATRWIAEKPDEPDAARKSSLNVLTA